MTRTNQQHIPHYNNIVKDVINQALESHPRTTVARVDLPFPQDYIYDDEGSKVITRFISSLKSRIQTNLRWKNKAWDRNHKCIINYAWVREYGDINNRKHYHLLIFLNKDVYYTLGSYNASGSLAFMIKQAWASALGLNSRFINIPVNFGSKVFYLDRNSDNLHNQVQAVIQSSTYLTKRVTKRSGDGYRSIGNSARRSRL